MKETVKTAGAQGFSIYFMIITDPLTKDERTAIITFAAAVKRSGGTILENDTERVIEGKEVRFRESETPSRRSPRECFGECF
ncbi:MAG: hypothetical protein U0L09_01105, partial [Christensenellales bacterium]|nr:hypothetical protein [Christensenellales bacterium]